MATLTDDEMTPIKYNTEFYPRYSGAYCAVRNMDHAVEKCTNPESMRYQLDCIGWSKELEEFLCDALACYRDKKRDEAIFNFKKRKAMAEKINFGRIQKMCKYHTTSYDSYYDKYENACHHPSNIPDGSSWGECCEEKCPFRKDE